MTNIANKATRVRSLPAKAKAKSRQIDFRNKLKNLMSVNSLSILVVHTFCWCLFFYRPWTISTQFRSNEKKTIKRRDRDIHNTPICSFLLLFRCLSAVFTLKTLLIFEWKIEPFNFLFRLVWCVLFSLSDVGWMELVFFCVCMSLSRVVLCYLTDLRFVVLKWILRIHWEVKMWIILISTNWNALVC